MPWSTTCSPHHQSWRSISGWIWCEVRRVLFFNLAPDSQPIRSKIQRIVFCSLLVQVRSQSGMVFLPHSPRAVFLAMPYDWLICLFALFWLVEVVALCLVLRLCWKPVYIMIFCPWSRCHEEAILGVRWCVWRSAVTVLYQNGPLTAKQDFQVGYLRCVLPLLFLLC